MSRRLMLEEPKDRPELEKLLVAARDHVMSPAERRAQRISWVRGQIWDREVGEEEAARAHDETYGKIEETTDAASD